MTRRCILVIYAIASILGLLAGARGNDSPANLLENDGFESWKAYAAPNTPVNPHAFGRYENSLAPAWWGAVTDSIEPRVGNGTIARDGGVRHGGSYAIRIRNTSVSDLSRVTSSLVNIEAGRSYRFSVWYKGENIEKGQTGSSAFGVVFTINQGPKEDFYRRRSSKDVTPKVADGTFDWRRVDIKFTARANTQVLMILMQLRAAKGTVWFDDAELVLEPGPTASAHTDSGRLAFGAAMNAPLFRDIYHRRNGASIAET